MTKDTKKMFSVRLSEETIERINKRAKELGVSKADVVSLAVYHYWNYLNMPFHDYLLKDDE